MPKKKTEEETNLVQSIRSFGYAVMVAQKRVFCLAPGTDVIFVLRKLQREGYWELNMVDRFMWEKYGAMGYPIRPHIIVPELLEFLYTYAAGQEAIKQGLIVVDEKAIFAKNNFEPPLERLQRRIREMWLRHDALFCDAYTGGIEGTKEYKAALKSELADPQSEHCKSRRVSKPIRGTNDGRYKQNQGSEIR